jgi:hypothetical protein
LSCLNDSQCFSRIKIGLWSGAHRLSLCSNLAGMFKMPFHSSEGCW